MSDHAPQLIRADTPEGPCVQLRGRWGAAEMGERAQWRVLKQQMAQLPPSADLGWDLRGVQWLDHVGAQLLWNHWGRTWPQRLQLQDGQRALLERAGANVPSLLAAAGTASALRVAAVLLDWRLPAWQADDAAPPAG